ncbi:hypothetical protein DCAR_0935054 [Daucus carota subsp. sativus]|uniref:Uncharacterized protein n=1 Tax=Daucus carota subsp. sativus TaxID=79200 RepID=A0A175YGW5_DAUCS|nr:hypothetical protein DCAR_0935054 [Daucus carota subsp. sativus]
MKLSAAAITVLLFLVITGTEMTKIEGARICAEQIDLKGKVCSDQICNAACVSRHSGNGKNFPARGYCNPSGQCACFWYCGPGR